MENLTNLSVIRDLCHRYQFSFSKGLGQNFLTNPGICPKMAELCGAGKESGVIEIGAGFGVLTNELAKRAKKVVVIEIDDRLLPVLKETLSEYENVKVILGDVMKVDLLRIIEEEFSGMDVFLCANLPYYLTSPILMRLLESKLPLKAITVMVQKEAAKRLTAKMPSKEAGAVTAAVRYYSDPKLLFQVNRGSFTPSPKVDSAVIQLSVKKELPLTGKEEERLFFLIRKAYNNRRKTLVNTLSLGGSKEETTFLLEKLGIRPTARPEELSLENWLSLAVLPEHR